jgi:membrane fusion protein (multidrug efflux system)
MNISRSMPGEVSPERLNGIHESLDRIAAALEKHNGLATDKRDSAGDDKAPKKSDDKNGEEHQSDQNTKSGEGKSFFLSPLGIVLEVVLVAMLVVGGLTVWLNSRKHVSTNDAYTAAHVHQISSRVAGTVMEVWVDDNQRVKTGDLLVKLDTHDFEVALQSAVASLDQAQANVTQTQAAVIQAQAAIQQTEAQVIQARAQRVQAQAGYTLAGVNFDRSSALFTERVVAKVDLDTTTSNRDATKASLDAANANTGAAEAAAEVAKAVKKSSEAAVNVAEAQVENARANLANANLQLSYCWVLAPCDGRVSAKTVETGQRLAAAQALLAVTENNVWVLANLKETQLGHVRVGMRVRLPLDAFPKHPFTGRVDSIQAGSGATYSLLPPDNATGNFTKIVQRVPVKLTFDPESIKGFEDLVVAGLSVTPEIDLTTTEKRP